ncbi:helix-turn-helix domain-containing protein [Priestia megaterium]
MGTNSFTMLMALASFMDEKGECYPTQAQLAERVGVHVNSANKYINELLEVQVDGKPLVTRKKLNKGQGKIFSYYKIHPLSQLAKFNGEIEPLETHKEDHKNSDSLITSKDTTVCDEIRSNNNHLNNIKLNSKTAIQYFQQIYKEVYGNEYVVGNYGRDGKLMKDKVITPYPELANRIIEVAVREYDSKWKNAKFPRPTISMFSWVVNSVVEILDSEIKLTEVAAQSSDLEEQAELEMLAKLNKLG